MDTRKCPICAKLFTPRSSGRPQKYCSDHTPSQVATWKRNGTSPPAPPKKAKAPRAPRSAGTGSELDAAGVLRALGYQVIDLGNANGKTLLAVG